MLAETHDNGQRPMAMGHLSVLSDQKCKKTSKLCVNLTFLEKIIIFKNWILTDNVTLHNLKMSYKLDIDKSRNLGKKVCSTYLSIYLQVSTCNYVNLPTPNNLSGIKL